ncbi:hypothetical protein NA57DRAFT_76004 [Rhizodiscina lignyota]|uniref:Uncharacterized protein n=1 Tax=Rhizodiscina lignyota TaxID=1504668 RepID=A0A9P4IBZ2_9PEZI|nr:hypothetical protein NA57DRAFT_76004 [Rhizodiscina lignyota]
MGRYGRLDSSDAQEAATQASNESYTHIRDAPLTPAQDDEGVSDGPRPTDQSHQLAPEESLLGSRTSLEMQKQDEKNSTFPPDPIPSIFSWHGWLLECGSLFIAFASLAGLSGLLAYYDEKVEPKFSLDVTLNTLVSIVSTVFAFSLEAPVATMLGQMAWTLLKRRTRSLEEVCVYDDASRGPTGSIRLLIRTKFLHVSAIGAVVTLLTLFLDPFFQQTLKYDYRPIIDDSMHSEALAAYQYNGSANSDLWNMISPDSGFGAIPYNLRAAIYDGLTSSNQLSLPYPYSNCPTGNCTWDPFGTLAVNVNCSNITSSVKIDCSNENTANQACTFKGNDDYLMATMLNGSTPTTWMVLGSAMCVQGNMNALCGTASAPLGMVHWVRVTGVSGDILGDSLQPNTGFEASRCLFYTAVNEIQPVVQNGTYSEQFIQEYHLAENSSLSYFNNDDKFSNSSDIPKGYNKPLYHVHNPYDTSDIIFKPPFAGGSPNLHDNFSIDGTAFWDLVSPFDGREGLSMIGGTLNTDLPDPNDLFRSSGASITLMLWESPDITVTMKNVAHYMTNALRNNDTLLLQNESHNSTILAPDQVVSGRVNTMAPFVVVRWAWLTLPLVSLLLAGVFIASGILMTYRSRVGLWKSNPLTLFFQARPKPTEDSESLLGTRTFGSADAMEDEAHQYEARVLPGDGLGIQIWRREAATSSQAT